VLWATKEWETNMEILVTFVGWTRHEAVHVDLQEVMQCLTKPGQLWFGYLPCVGQVKNSLSLTTCTTQLPTAMTRLLTALLAALLISSAQFGIEPLAEGTTPNHGSVLALQVCT
jgi:hypothetical protein